MAVLTGSTSCESNRRVPVLFARRLWRVSVLQFVQDAIDVIYVQWKFTYSNEILFFRRKNASISLSPILPCVNNFVEPFCWNSGKLTWFCLPSYGSVERRNDILIANRTGHIMETRIRSKNTRQRENILTLSNFLLRLWRCLCSPIIRRMFMCIL